MNCASALAYAHYQAPSNSTNDLIQNYLDSVSREPSLPDNWNSRGVVVTTPPLSDVYYAICELEKVAADSLITAHSRQTMSVVQIEEFLFGLSKSADELPSPFQVCCLRHVEAELRCLQDHGSKKLLFIGGGSFPTTGINAALRGFDVTLVDLDPFSNLRAQKLAKTLTPSVQSRLHFVTANATTLRLRHHDFDAAFLAAMVAPKDAVLLNLARQLRMRGGPEPLILSRGARSAISCGLFEEDPGMLVSSSAHIATVCISSRCDTRCRVYSVPRMIEVLREG